MAKAGRILNDPNHDAVASINSTSAAGDIRSAASGIEAYGEASAFGETLDFAAAKSGFLESSSEAELDRQRQRDIASGIAADNEASAFLATLNSSLNAFEARAGSTTADPPYLENFNLDSKTNRGIYQLYITEVVHTPGDSEVRISPIPDGVNITDNSLLRFESGLVHEFLTAPHTIEMMEQAATTIQPTLGLGKYIDEQGQATKLITVAGTTGFRPNTRFPGAEVSNVLKDSVTNALKYAGANIDPTFAFGPSGLAIRDQTRAAASAIADPIANTIGDLLPQGALEIGPFDLSTNKDDRGIGKGEVTGFDELNSLKNLFRIYFDIKEGRATTRSNPTAYSMVWVDMYSYEFWTVVPVSFQVNRSATKPFQFEYRIQLKTVEPLSNVLTNIFKPLPTKSDNLFSRARKVLKDVREVFLDSKNVIDATANRTRREVLGTIHESRQTYNVVANALGDPGSFFGGSFNQLGKDIKRSLSDFKDDISGGDTKKDRYTASSSDILTPESLNASDGTTTANIFDDAYTTAVATKDAISANLSAEEAFDSELSQAVNDIIRSSNALRAGLASLEAQSSISSGDIEFIRSEFGLARERDATGSQATLSGNFGHILDARNMGDPLALDETIVEVGETIYDISQRIFGTKLYYKVLVLINKLRYPYIADVPSTGVLAPGDLLKFPGGVGSLGGNNVAVREDSDVDSRYGTDVFVKLTGGEVVLQLENGDFKRVVGKSNLAQAVGLKNVTPQGSLPAHPRYGVPVNIGSKVNPAVVANLNLSLKAMYLSDPRIETVNSIRTQATGDLMLIQSELKAVGSDEGFVQRFGVI
jgi:hypothetical protein